MLLLYYDEVKYQPPAQKSYMLGGICVPAGLVREIEDQVSDVAERAFGSRLLGKGTELHGIEICRGKGNCKGIDFEVRMSMLADLLKIITREDIFRIRVKINPENITHTSKNPADIAFMYFVECADTLFKKHDSVGMLFGDYDEPVIGTSVATLSQFRRGGTQWARAKEITNIIDTVHFAKSHHSRLIQLADIFLYCFQFLYGENSSPWRRELQKIIADSNLLYGVSGKDWPGEPRWYR